MTITTVDGEHVQVRDSLLNAIYITSAEQVGVSAAFTLDGVLIVNNNPMGMALCLSGKHYTVGNIATV